MFSPFDNLGETMQNIVHQQIPLPTIIRKKLARNIIWPYRKGMCERFIDITYDWSNRYTPRMMMQYIDPHILCIFVYAAQVQTIYIVPA